jgi:hypothetical protein
LPHARSGESRQEGLPPESLERVVLRDVRERREISDAKAPMLRAVSTILESTRDFWPLSVRQIHYRLLPLSVLMHAAKPESFYQNTKACYDNLVDLLTRARLEGLVPWEAITDTTRPVMVWNNHPDLAAYLAVERENILTGYRRDYLQSQSSHIEIVAEKLTVEGVISPVAYRYGITYTIGRGYSAIEVRKKLCERFSASSKKKLTLLLLSDFDPDGKEITHSFVRSLRGDFGLAENKIDAIQVALTLAQIRGLALPPVMTAKRSSSNYERFVDRFGEAVYELEAVAPDVLQTFLSEAIKAVIDHRGLEREKRTEEQELDRLEIIRQRIRAELESESL